jgi:hypothetical protein
MKMNYDCPKEIKTWAVIHFHERDCLIGSWAFTVDKKAALFPWIHIIR